MSGSKDQTRLASAEAVRAPIAPPKVAPPQPPGLSGRLGDLARLLPILGAFLLVSPLVRVFAVPAAPAGVPLIVWYIFGVWAALIVGAVALGRRVSAVEDAAREAARGEAGAE